MYLSSVEFLGTCEEFSKCQFTAGTEEPLCHDWLVRQEVRQTDGQTILNRLWVRAGCSKQNIVHNNLIDLPHCLLIPGGKLAATLQLADVPHCRFEETEPIIGFSVQRSYVFLFLWAERKCLVGDADVDVSVSHLCRTDSCANRV